MKRTLSTMALCLLGALSLPAADIYVNGSSTASGEDGSKELPYKTLKAALSKTKGGDTVIVAAGTYRENIIRTYNEFKEKVTIRAAEGARPVLSGFDIVSNWKKGEDGLYRTTVNFKPRRLLVDRAYQPVARLPELGWSTMTSTGKNTFSAPITDKIEPGTSCFVWYGWGNFFGTVQLKNSPKPGQFEMEPNRGRYGKTEPFYFTNHACLIRKNGQWAYKQLDKKTYEIAIKWEGDLNKKMVEVSGARDTILVRYSTNLYFSGFDVMGFNQSGIEFGACKNVGLSRMGFFWNGNGTRIRGCENSSIYDCRFAANGSGVSCLGNTNFSLHQSDIGYNEEDGVTITWKTKGAHVENCRVHHQLWRGHPDNIQFYRDVADVTLKNNLFFCGGQGLMAEQINNFTLENNAFIGADAAQVIWGHGNSDNITMLHNTVLFGGWGGVTVTGDGNNFHHNVIQGLNIHGYAKDRKYVGSNNLYIKKNKIWRDSINKGWPYSFEEFLKLSGETNTQRQILPIKGMPTNMGVIERANLVNCTTDKVYLRVKGAKDFQVGDTIEIRFDGVPRTVTKATESYICFTPALKYPPVHTYIVMNWKQQKDLKWNPQFISKAGATQNLEDIRIDNRTSVPMPKEVQDYIDNIDRLIP